LAGVIGAACALSGCLGSDGGSPRRVDAAGIVSFPSEQRLSRLGLVVGPPANLIRACRRVARDTALMVYCPPIVPEGPVETPKRRHENAYLFGDERGYGLSLQSESLIDPETARAYDPQGPPITFPSRPREADYVWDPFAAKHWVVAATAPARGLVKTVDRSIADPRLEFRSRRRRFTLGGIEATRVTGDLAGSGFAGSGHAIVYWTTGDTFHQVSVHFDDKARVAEMIARGLIAQMAYRDPPARSGREICNWVFPGQGGDAGLKRRRRAHPASRNR
jgi:hypothetical protein